MDIKMLPVSTPVESDHLRGILPSAVIAQPEEENVLTLTAVGFRYHPELPEEERIEWRDKHWLSRSVGAIIEFGLFSNPRFRVTPADMKTAAFDIHSPYRTVNPCRILLTCFVPNPIVRGASGEPSSLRYDPDINYLHPDLVTSRYARQPDSWQRLAEEKLMPQVIVACIGQQIEDPLEVSARDFEGGCYVRGPVVPAPYELDRKTSSAWLQMLFARDFAIELIKRPDVSPKIRDSLRENPSLS